MRYILNSAVLTAPGLYEYTLIDIETAKGWLAAGPFESTIRYSETASALSRLTGVDIPVRSVTCRMVAGDEALVFRLVLPPSTGRIPTEIKGNLAEEFILQHCEVGLLKLLSKPPRKKARGHLRGEEHGRARLTKDKIREAHRLHFDEGATMESLEHKYGVTRYALYKAWKGTSWKE